MSRKQALLTSVLMILSLVIGVQLTSFYNQATYEDQQLSLAIEKQAQTKAYLDQLQEISSQAINQRTRLGIMSACLYGDHFRTADGRQMKCEDFTKMMAQNQVKF